MTTQSDNPQADTRERRSTARRSLLGGVPLLAALTACRSGTPSPGGARGGAGGTGGTADPRPPGEVPARAVAAAGGRQAGVDRPAQPQGHAVVSVYGFPPEAPFGEVLARLGREVLELTGSSGAALDGVAAGDLTVTVGVGPRLSAGAGRGGPGDLELPAFAREERTARTWGGDLLVQTCASDPVALLLADVRLAARLTAEGASRRWSQTGFRPPGGGPVRNLLGFPDGIEIPRSRGELEREVWLPGPGPAAGGTIAVVRRLRIDVPGFLAQPTARQEEAVGRRKTDGSPLSGGGPLDRPDLSAKSPRGRYLVPAMAHARRANPNATGSGRMLRRGYSYHNGPEDQGLLFVSFQRQLRTFTATQRRLDDGDELMGFVTATASGAFLILPGFGPELPLGAALFRDGR
ncbi:Dyp-type peroxidase [Streptomyces sp. NPDC048603]|uniref:Dyp-type peroxidase n=1 Tax=Streptomyces sp. NPDC048603 TaxID=3365577 RepID=UPI00371E90CE